MDLLKSGIYIQRVTKNYAKKRGIENVELELPGGGLTAIVGPSGCGKTTLLRSLAGFLQIDKGNIFFGDKDVTLLSPQERGAAMVFQNYALWPHMSVFDNIAYGLKILKVPRMEREHRVYKILESVEISAEDIKKRRPSEYSGGQQQRIALARSLVIQPKVLLLDEPLSNLDAKVRQRLRVEIREIQQTFGITTVYVTHDQEEALSMADYVVVMNEGKVEQAGKPEEVYRNPSSYFTAQFLGESTTIQIDYHGKPMLLVIRAEDARLSKNEAMVSTPSSLQITENDSVLILQGYVKEQLFVGSRYRHVIDIGGQIVFVDDNQPWRHGPILVTLPKERAFWFNDVKQAHSLGVS
ncbi:ABC transporter ATP-binding protein [Ectobacillus polymachus]|uniref:ABC transporter ATP-binding protein n=1 Tax=Ectobacillus polymachus TaxID=1508806 RepID=UPI003A8483B3